MTYFIKETIFPIANTMCGIVFPFFLLLLLPSTAVALPTPDALISLINITPLAAGTIATIIGGFYIGLRKKFGSNGSTFILMILVFLILCSSFGIYIFHKNRVQDRINQIAMYLRCDLAGHEISHRWKQEKHPDQSPEMWKQYGNFIPIDFDLVKQLLLDQPNALLVDISPREIAYHAGFPAVNLGETIKPFIHLRSNELIKKLDEANAKDLYLYEFVDYKRFPELFLHDKSVFSKFDHIYLVQRVGNNDRYYFDERGILQKTERTKAIQWPVEEERWIINEKVVSFPNMAKLVTNQKAASFILDNSIYIVAPHDSHFRSQPVQKLYFKKLLSGIPKERILIVDMNSPETEDRLKEIAEIIDGKKFIILGLSKYDWLYSGLDAGYNLWQNLNRDQERFRLLGFNTRLPEVVAINWENTSRAGVIESLKKPFWKAVHAIHSKVQLHDGAIILLIAILLRLIVFPIGFKESYSRITRGKILQLKERQPGLAWQSSIHTLFSNVKVGAAWEMLGGLVTLLLLFPAYKILAIPPKEEAEWLTFLWIKNIQAPDYFLGVMVGLLIFLKIFLSSKTRRLLLPATMSILFTLVLFTLPSILLIYVTGVLLVTLSQDILALKISDLNLKRALLQTV